MLLGVVLRGLFIPTSLEAGSSRGPPDHQGGGCTLKRRSAGGTPRDRVAGGRAGVADRGGHGSGRRERPRLLKLAGAMPWPRDWRGWSRYTRSLRHARHPTPPNPPLPTANQQQSVGWSQARGPAPPRGSCWPALGGRPTAYGASYASSTERIAAVDGWLHNYIHHRRHQAIGRQTPSNRSNNLLGLTRSAPGLELNTAATPPTTKAPPAASAGSPATSPRASAAAPAS